MHQKNTTMKPHYLTTIFLITYFLTYPTTANSKFPNSNDEERNRRILHQPLFPISSSPPPLPPPAPPTPDFSDQDEQPFSHELPMGPPTQDQIPQSPPSPATGTNVAHPVATKPSKPTTKKVAIAIISAILTLAMLSVMVFYLYKNRGDHHSDSQKLVAENSNSQMFNHEESRIQQSTNFLSVETAEASTTSGSPYRKTNWAKRSERYRPSPELQPLPPLKKLPPPPGINSPPPMTSSDDEREDTSFFTSRGTSMRTNSPSNHVVSSVPHSKRTSPKSRFSASSSPDTKPSIKPPSPTSLGPLQASKTLPYIPKIAKFSASPPPTEIQTIRKNEQQISKTQIPPPPPPPPPSMPRKYGAVKTHTPLPISKQIIRPRSKNPSPRASPPAEKARPVEEHKKSVNSSEKLDVEEIDGSRTIMKALHWDKVRATSDRGTVWDQLDSNSFRLNEDAMESLFGCNSRKSVPREATKKLVLPSYEQEIRILDSKKSQNIAILLRALNVTREEVSEALLDGNPEGLGPELFETLVKMAPTKEEEIKLKNYNDEGSKLGAAERFLRAILDIPFAFKRVEALLYRANFDAEVKYLRKSFQTLEEASEELKNSRLFLKLLEAVLRTGNRMNDGTNRGDAKAFKLDTLLKLVDIKGKDGKTTLLHFVVQEIIRSEGEDSNPTNEILPQKSNFKFNEEDFKKQGLQVVAGLSKELGNVKKAAGMDSDVLSSYVSKLETGLQIVRQVLQHENQSMHGKFFDSMKVFLQDAVDEISRVKAEERKALSFVKEVTQYFHGDAAKQEAHPLRIFMIIRDFLSILDNVCKDVGRMQDRTTMGAGRSFRISATTPMPVLNRFNVPNYRSSDDDSM